ncbi:MAG: HEAT repeat domain-containing protein [bacterium]
MNNEALKDLFLKIEQGSILERNEAFNRLEEYPLEQIKHFLFDGLRSNHHRVRSRCAKIIGDKGDETVLFPLLQALGDESWSVRSSANEALSRLPENIVLPALNAIMDSSQTNPVLLKSVVSLLDKYQHPDSTRILVNVLQNSEDPELIEAAVSILGKKQDALSIDSLFGLLTHELWIVRKAAVTAISNLPWPTIKPHLIQAIGNPNRFMHLAGIEILTSIASDDVLDMLAEILKSRNTTAKLNALNVLSGINTDESYSTMVAVLDDENIRVRDKAIYELSRSSLPSIFDLLNRCVNSTNKILKLGAIQVFGEMGTEASVDILQNLLEKESGNIKIRVMEALARSGTRRSIKLLLQHIAMPDYTAEITTILKSIDPDLAIQQIVNLLDEPDFFPTAVRGLLDFDKSKVLRYLSSKLTSETGIQQERTVEAMGLLGSPEALVYLENILDGDFPDQIKKKAETSLRRIRRSM